MAIRLTATLIMVAALVPTSGSVTPAGVEGQNSGEVPAPIANSFRPPPEFANDLGAYKSPLVFNDGRPVRDAAPVERQNRDHVEKIEKRADVRRHKPKLAVKLVSESEADHRGAEPC